MTDFSEELLAHIKRFEGWRADPYKDPVGIETVGYGHVIRNRDQFTFPLSEVDGEELLKSDLSGARRDTLALSPNLTARRLDAITDFCFNVGAPKYATSTLRKRVNAEKWEDAAHEMGRWVYAGGEVLAGLVKRRAVAAEWLREG